MRPGARDDTIYNGNFAERILIFYATPLRCTRLLPQPQRAFFRLSDDGSMLGFMEPASIDENPARMNVFVQALQGSTPTGRVRRLTSETERDIAQFFWKGAQTVIYEKDFNGDENFHVIAVNADTGDVRDLTPFPGVRASIEDDLEDDPGHIPHQPQRAQRRGVRRLSRQHSHG